MVYLYFMFIMFCESFLINDDYLISLLEDFNLDIDFEHEFLQYFSIFNEIIKLLSVFTNKNIAAYCSD